MESFLNNGNGSEASPYVSRQSNHECLCVVVTSVYSWMRTQMANPGKNDSEFWPWRFELMNKNTHQLKRNYRVLGVTSQIVRLHRSRYNTNTTFDHGRTVTFQQRNKTPVAELDRNRRRRKIRYLGAIIVCSEELRFLRWRDKFNGVHFEDLFPFEHGPFVWYRVSIEWESQTEWREQESLGFVLVVVVVVVVDASKRPQNTDGANTGTDQGIPVKWTPLEGEKVSFDPRGWVRGALLPSRASVPEQSVRTVHVDCAGDSIGHCGLLLHGSRLLGPRHRSDLGHHAVRVNDISSRHKTPGDQSGAEHRSVLRVCVGEPS